MHFTSLLAASAAVTGALAGVYYDAPEPTTTPCTTSVVPDYEPTEVPVYEPTASPEEPTEYGCSDVVYTSYSTYENVADYKVYTSTYYSTSTCPHVEPEPTYEPVPVPKNCTTTPVYDSPEPTYEAPVPTYEPTYEEPVPEPTYTKTYYTTVCPGKSYCYATTVTSTWCPGSTTVVPHPTYEPEHPTYEPVPPPTYTKPSCPGYGCHNETVPAPPPSYTGAASSNAVSFGAAAFAGLVALFVAA